MAFDYLTDGPDSVSLNGNKSLHMSTESISRCDRAPVIGKLDNYEEAAKAFVVRIIFSPKMFQKRQPLIKLLIHKFDGLAKVGCSIVCSMVCLNARFTATVIIYFLLLTVTLLCVYVNAVIAIAAYALLFVYLVWLLITEMTGL